MKKLITASLGLLFVLTTATGVMAAPNNENKAQNNPNIVAYYPMGLHAIPTDPITYVMGTNLVMKRGNSGQIEAWYTQTDNHGIHSVWNLSKSGACSNNQILIKKAYPSWGDYLVPGADYCVLVNSF